jgi:deoxyadenosine/deoxycytidine kinase
MATIIITEGIIGAGKSTILQVLRDEYIRKGKKVCIIPEPVDKWIETGALEEFYRNPKDFAYKFQTHALATRIDYINRAMKAAPDADIVLIERSPASDNIFWKLQDSTECEKKMYDSWYGMWQPLLPFDLKDAKVIYLHTSLDQCMKRVAKRARSEEISGVTREYQQSLLDAHDAFMLSTDCPYSLNNIIVVDHTLADLDFCNKDRQKVMDYIFDKLENGVIAQ